MICPKNVTGSSKSSDGCLDSIIINAGANGEGQPGSPGRTSDPVDVRVGGHAYDRSYAEIELVSWNVSGKLLDLRLRWGQTKDKHLVWLCTTLSSSTADPSDFELRFVASYTWMRAGTAAASTSTAIGATFDSYGLGQTTLAVLSGHKVAVLGNDLSPVAFATTPLATGKDVGLTSDPTTYNTAAAVKTVLDSAAAVQTAIYAKYGAEGAEVRRAVEAAVMWNFIYVPVEAGPFAPVSRGWSFAPSAVSHDWDYVIFGETTG